MLMIAGGVQPILINQKTQCLRLHYSSLKSIIGVKPYNYRFQSCIIQVSISCRESGCSSMWNWPLLLILHLVLVGLDSILIAPRQEGDANRVVQVKKIKRVC